MRVQKCRVKCYSLGLRMCLLCVRVKFLGFVGQDTDFIAGCLVLKVQGFGFRL